MPGFITAFPGPRDRYQLPLALAEVGLLDRLLTDLYPAGVLRPSRAMPGRVAQRVGRGEPSIATDLVRPMPTVFAAMQLARLRYRTHARAYAATDHLYARAAARAARRRRSDLVLYAPYAFEALTARYRHEPRKVVFYYHPHPATERRILADDFRRYPHMVVSHNNEVRPEVPAALVARVERAWEPAELILCVSSFTARSIVEAGADPSRCRVVPYGVDAPADDACDPPERFEVLFVGTGGQRKGLHHLLAAWRGARLPSGARVTLVCRSVDPALEPEVRQTPGVRLLTGISAAAELAAAYRSSTAFVMPSMVEGFGHVYLEAMAHGCPVVGTANSVLPDIGGESDGVFQVPAADVDALVAMLERLAGQLPGDGALRRATQARARRFTWAGFRQGVREALAG